jgi:hypothetical protein
VKVVAAERSVPILFSHHVTPSLGPSLSSTTHKCSKEGHARSSFDTRCNSRTINMSLALSVCIYCVASQKQSGAGS